MNTVYDLLLNFNFKIYDFFEWSLDDNIDHIKKTTFFKITTSELYDFYMKNVKVTNEFLKKIENTTVKYDLTRLKYVCIFTDGNTSVAISFDEDGKVSQKSKLQPEDEEEIIRFSKRCNIEKIEYEILNNEIEHRIISRKDEYIKNYIISEIKKIYQNNELSKLEYLYLEYFDKLDKNFETMKDNLLRTLDSEIDEKHYNLYNLLLLATKEKKTNQYETKEVHLNIYKLIKNSANLVINLANFVAYILDLV